jgi:Domain of unknown function (DUF4382)
MPRAPRLPAGIFSSPGPLVTAVFLFLALMGCGDSCLLIVSNPGGGGGTVAGSIPNCSLGTATGNVRVRVTLSQVPSTNSDVDRIDHIFVTMRGVEANPSATADDKASGWEELAPKLATQPEQLDLLAHSEDSCATSALGDVRIPANQYRQIRVRLLDNEADFSNFLLQQNSCGSVAFNCVVTHDGGIHALELDGEPSPQIQISSENIDGGFFRVVPDTASDLEIKFVPQSSRWINAEESTRLVPVFTAAPQAACESAARLDH